MARAGLIEADVAVVGAGAAGLYAALTAARAGARVALVSAAELARTASYWAQGGIAAALAVGDSPDRHREDTERAGRGLVRTSAAAVLCREAPGVVALELMQFHPTAVTGVAGREGFLVTEAIRGEGARLLNADGERFVDELAPRDEVARAIHERMAASGAPHVHLDMRDVDPLLF